MEVRKIHTRCWKGTRFPHESLVATHADGVTEPWVAQVVSSLLVASGAKTVLETGGFMGITSSWLALTLESMGGGKLIVCEVDAERQKAIHDRLASLDLMTTDWGVAGDVMPFIHAQPDQSLDFIWLDDDHQQPHVAAEIEALWPKMKPGGLIVGHDIDEPCNLHEVFSRYGGYSIRLPKLGPAGGIGVLQIPA